MRAVNSILLPKFSKFAVRKRQLLVFQWIEILFRIENTYSISPRLKSGTTIACPLQPSRPVGLEVRNVEISRATQLLLNGKFHDFLAIFALAHAKINQIA